MDIGSTRLKNRTICYDMKLSTKRGSLKSRPSSVCHDFYNKWARRRHGETMESDSDTGGHQPWTPAESPSPRYAKQQRTPVNPLFKHSASSTSPNLRNFNRPKSRNRIYLDRAGSCVYPSDLEPKNINDPRIAKSALDFQSLSKLPSINSQKLVRPDINTSGYPSPRSYKKSKAKADQQVPFHMNNAVLNFTEDIVLRGDKYVFIDQLYRKCKDTRASVTVERVTVNQSGGRHLARAQLIDFGEIKQILSLRRERLQKERLENLRKSDYTSISVPSKAY
ncbi:hypothetical protein SNE40_002068 [Patella caerulea]|uniref:Uncharacterized protein n=1 Tax=Patella caerulea TaxID=87958 RepID=A0AAN8K6G5_PATCE